MVEALFLDEGGKIGAEAGGAGRLVHYYAATGLLHRGFDCLDVDRYDGAKFDDFGVYALSLSGGEGDVDHRAVGEDGHRLAVADDFGLAERHGVMFLRHLGLGLLGPGRHRALVIAVARAVVDALAHADEVRVVVLDRGDAKTRGVAWV